MKLQPVRSIPDFAIIWKYLQEQSLTIANLWKVSHKYHCLTDLNISLYVYLLGCKQSYSGGATSAEQMEKESHDNFSFHPDNDDIEALKSKITYDTEAANVY